MTQQRLQISINPYRPLLDQLAMFDQHMKMYQFIRAEATQTGTPIEELAFRKYGVELYFPVGVRPVCPHITVVNESKYTLLLLAVPK